MAIQLRACLFSSLLLRAPTKCRYLHHKLYAKMLSSGHVQDEKETITKKLAQDDLLKTSKNKFFVHRAKQAANESSTTLVIVFGFYGASDRAMNNYLNIYQKYGFDVVYVQSLLKHFAWPNNSVLLATILLEFIRLQCAEYQHILVHAFSMGAFNFTVCLGEMYSQPALYFPVQAKIRAIVYDSLTVGSLKNMITGIGQGISTNPITRIAVPVTVTAYFYLTHSHTVCIYNYYVDLFKKSPLQVPTLMFYCKQDPMSEYDSIKLMLADWKTHYTFEITEKSWEKSKHSAHLMVHREEYLDTLHKFLCSIGEIGVSMKINPKL